MKKNDDIIKLTEKYLIANYARYPIALVKGKGVKVWDQSGKEYIDFASGIAVNNLGHCHPKITQAIRKQAGELLHVSNLYHIGLQSRLAEELTRLSFAQKIFFCNSGTEANEAAIKLARRFSYDQGHKNRYEIISMKNSFHGRTMGALSATGQKKLHAGFGPMLKGFKHIPFNDIDAAKKAVSPKTCAIMTEPIQGETGVNIASKKWMKALRKLCDANNLLLILDEVQTGFGRTGTLFAYQQFGIKPDIMTLAKGLGGGVPMGAMATSGKAAKSFAAGSHGTTLGGNPLACSAALASLNILGKKSFLQDAKKKGEYLKSRLLELSEKYEAVKEVRGMGMILAMDLNTSSADVVSDCMRQGVLINGIKPNTLRFLPPLIASRKDIDQVIRVLSGSLAKL